jgi:hypothetical protein
MIPWTKRHCKNCDKDFIFCSGHFSQNNSCPDCESTLFEVQPSGKRYATKDNEAYGGIKIPISFRYSYRGIKDAVLEVYFSPHPVSEDSIKSIAILRSITEENTFKSPHFKNGVEHLETHSTHGVINHLIPYKTLENENSKHRQGILSSLNIDRSNTKLADKYLNNIPLIDKNPSTGTYNDIIGLFPAKDNDLDTLLQAFNHPPFYISINDGIFVLKIRHNNHYHSIPSQHYCPPNVNALPTPTISLTVRDKETQKIVNLHPIWNYKDIEWEKVAKDIIESNNEQLNGPNIHTKQS